MIEDTDREEDTRKRIDPSARFSDVELAAVPMGPAATPLAGPIGSTPPIPDATPATFICLRGPCRHYWQMSTHVESGNPKETWDPEIGLKDADGNPVRQPKQINRVCLAHPGVETELDDNIVYSCTRWSPLTPREVRKLEKLRAKYYKQFPEHDPLFVPASRLTR